MQLAFSGQVSPQSHIDLSSNAYSFSHGGAIVSQDTVDTLTSSASNVRGLTFSETIIDAQVARVLAALPNLRSLSFLNSRLDSSARDALGESLRSHKTLGSLELANCNVTEEDLDVLWLSRVSRLDIDGASVNASKLRELEPHPTISALTFINNSISTGPDGAEALRALAIPSILFDVAIREKRSIEDAKKFVSFSVSSAAQLDALRHARDFSRIDEIKLQKMVVDINALALLPKRMQSLVLLDCSIGEVEKSHLRKLGLRSCLIVDTNMDRNELIERTMLDVLSSYMCSCFATGEPRRYEFYESTDRMTRAR